MKIFGKILSVLMVFLILIFGILSVSGFSYYHGDNEVTVIKGFNDLKFSDDLGGGYKFILTPATIDEFSSDAKTIVDVIEKRSAAIGFNDYRMYIQDSTGNVEFIIPEDVDSDYGSIELASYLLCIGDVTIRPNNSFLNYNVDSTGNKLFTDFFGTDSEPVIMDREYIDSASTVNRKVDGKTYHCLDIKLNDSGKEYLSQITDPTANVDASYYNSVVSFWIDNRMISYDTLTEHLTDGVISVSDENITAEECDIYAAIINSDSIMLQIADIQFIEGHNVSLKMVNIVALAILLILAFVLIYRYRLNCFITLLCVIFQFSLILSVCTGFFANAGGIVIDTASVVAFVISLMLTIFSGVIVSEKLRSQLAENNKVQSADISKAFKASGALILDIHIVLLLISLMGVVVFGTNGFAISLFGSAACGAVNRFSLILLIGSFADLISGYLLPLFLAKNFNNIKLIAKASLTGGKK